MNKVAIPSDRKFGTLLVAIFAIAGLHGLYKNWDPLTVSICFIGALIFTVITIFLPKRLEFLKTRYLSLGYAMGKVVSPIVLGVIFYFLITPIGYWGRLFNRDELKIKKIQCKSYWLDNVESLVSAESFKKPY